MPSYSHRDLRVFRGAHRRIATVTAATLLLVTAVELAPFSALKVLALGGLAVLGGVALLVSTRLVEAYVQDLQQVRSDRGIAVSLRVEVESLVELERAVSAGTRPSPHSRRRHGDRSPGIGRGSTISGIACAD